MKTFRIRGPRSCFRRYHKLVQFLLQVRWNTTNWAYKIYSIKTYSDNMGIAIIIGISEIVTVEFWSLVLLYQAGGRWSLTFIF